MSQTRTERVQMFADIHVKARLAANKSQEFMAIELGVAKKQCKTGRKESALHPSFKVLNGFVF